MSEPTLTWKRDTSVAQWAAVRTVLSLRRLPPQKGRLDPVPTRATCRGRVGGSRRSSRTCQGYSFFRTACPPTIRLRATFFTPHLQEVKGAKVGAGVTGAGGARQQEERQMEQESRRKGDHILQAKENSVWEEQDRVFMLDCDA